jgi:hypothetical protein
VGNKVLFLFFSFPPYVAQEKLEKQVIKKVWPKPDVAIKIITVLSLDIVRVAQW